jgi:NitT/TauT family transport system ATP-binding protein
MILNVEKVNHNFGPKKVLHNVNLLIPQGQIVGLVGPSGCGKSTLLKAILGTHPPSDGRVVVDSKEMLSPNRNAGIVYQHYSLYDFLTAQQNVAFGLMLDQTSLFWPIHKSRVLNYLNWRKLQKAHLRQAAELLEKLGLGAANNLYPTEMSGGMRQRVAIAQALIMKPKVLLLDEPFGALDEATREELQEMILGFAQENIDAKNKNESPPHTIVMVTHELHEAIYVCDRVVGLSQYYVGGHSGATIIYDKACPDFLSRKSEDLNLINSQKQDLRNVVFSEELVWPEENVTYWKEEALEQLWKEQKGVNPQTGKMWLTPRMEREAKKIEKAWKN